MTRSLSIVFLSPILLLLAPASVHASGGGDAGGLGLVSAIGLAIVSACVLAVAFSFVKVPALLAYILSGLLLGVAATPLLGESIAIMTHISHLGLVFLLFIIGLEMDLGGILRLGPRAGLAVFLQAPIAIAAVLGLQSAARAAGLSLPGLGDDPASFFYFAVACSLGSTAVVVKLLGDKFDLDSKAGRITVLTLIAEDIWAVLALSYVLSQGGGHGEGGGMVLMIGGGAGLAAGYVLFTRYVLSPVMRRFSTSPDMLLLIALGWCFLCAEGMSRVGLSAEMGALIAGLTIGRLPTHVEILAKVSSLRDFFMALFFVALGMTLPLPTTQVMVQAVGLVVVVVLARLMLFAPTLLWAGSGPIVAFASAVNLSQVSEFTLLLVPVGITAGSLSVEQGMVISYGLMLSVVLTGFTLKHNYRIALILGRLLDRTGSSGIPETGARPGHASDGGHPAEIVLLGYFLNTEALARQLAATNAELLKRILVIDFNLQNHTAIRRHGLRVVYGDIANLDTLRHHGIAEARVIVSTINNAFLRGITNQDLVSEIIRLNPGARVIATADRHEEAADLTARGAFRVVSPSVLAAPVFIRTIEEALASGPAGG